MGESIQYLLRSTWHHTKPKKPLLAPADIARITCGLLVSAVLGILAESFFEDGRQIFVLLNVGSFFGALISLLGGSHSKTVTMIAGLLVVDGGALLGVLLVGHPLVAVAVVMCGLFLAGLVRTISVGFYMRVLFGTVAVAAVSEMGGAAAGRTEVLTGLVPFVLGQLIMVSFGMVRRRSLPFRAQREAVAELYRRIGAAADGRPAGYVAARVSAQRSLGAAAALEVTGIKWLRRLLVLAETVSARRPGDPAALEEVVVGIGGGGSSGSGAPPRRGGDRTCPGRSDRHRSRRRLERGLFRGSGPVPSA